jgi:hypothetical protein
MPRHVFGEALVQGFSLGLMAKDVGLGCQLLPEDMGGLSLALRVRERLLAELTELGPDADINETIETYERAAHATVATSQRPARRSS